MNESIEKENNTKVEDKKSINGKVFYSGIAALFFIGAVLIGTTKLINSGIFDRKADSIYAELKDYQTCKVISEEGGLKNMDSIKATHALICELSPVQQKTPESVQLAQNKIVELNKEITEFKSKTIKELNILLQDDFVRKNPERAIDNILTEMKKFDLCLVVSSENKMAVDCSLKEKETHYSYNLRNEVEKVNEYYQIHTKINHQLGLIDKKYFTYFKNERDKEIKEVKHLDIKDAITARIAQDIFIKESMIQEKLKQSK